MPACFRGWNGSKDLALISMSLSTRSRLAFSIDSDYIKLFNCIYGGKFCASEVLDEICQANEIKSKNGSTDCLLRFC